MSDNGTTHFADDATLIHISNLEQERDKLMEEVAMLEYHLQNVLYSHNPHDQRSSDVRIAAYTALSSTTSADEWLAGKIKEANSKQCDNCTQIAGG